MRFARWAVALIVVFAAAVLGACTATRAEAAPKLKAASQRKAAPDFALKDSNGATVHLRDYRGKVVLLDFWATWCGPCKIEIPWFMEFDQTYRNRGFAVVGVAMDDEGWDAVKPYIESRKMNYRVLLGNDQIADLYGGVEAMPTTFLIDREGRIAAVHQGLSSKDGFRDEIEELLSAHTDNRRAARSAPASASTGR